MAYPSDSENDSLFESPEKMKVPWPDYDTDDLELWYPSEEEERQKSKTHLSVPTNSPVPESVETDTDKPMPRPLCQRCKADKHPEQNCRKIIHSDAQVFLCQPMSDTETETNSHLSSQTLLQKPLSNVQTALRTPIVKPIATRRPMHESVG